MVFTEDHKRKLRENSSRYWLGKKRYPETIEKLRIAAMGKIRHSDPHSEETKKKISQTKINSLLTLRGERHPFYKDGQSRNRKREYKTFKFNKWRRSVYERDNFICQMCGQKGKELNCHHIKSFTNFSKIRFDISNGITLCKDCHMNLHGLKKKEDRQLKLIYSKAIGE